MGRTTNVRIPYRAGCHRTGHCRIMRTAGHETMPYFAGPWFPKRDADNMNGLFEASMLALFKPWRSMLDLKTHDLSFREAYDCFVSSAPESVLRRIQNIGYFHECSDGARAQRQNIDIPNSSEQRHENCDDELDVVTDPIPVHPIPSELLDTIITEDDIQRTLERPFPTPELLYADIAISIGLDTGVLHNDVYDIALPRPVMPASETVLRQCQTWQAEMTEMTNNRDDKIRTQQVDAFSQWDQSDDVTMADLTEPTATPLIDPELTMPSASTHLNERQSMVLDIVSNHLQMHLRNLNPPQRLMIVHGQGGTGKSALLNAISETFLTLGVPSLLAKTAMSGVAASVIGGHTLHNWAALPITIPRTNKWITHPGKQVENRRRHNMGNTLWLAIDEKSMMTTPLLTLLSQATGTVRSSLSNIDPTIAFGGLNVILFGDFHQFPPVANNKRELYNSNPPHGICQLGRNLFEQFDIVIQLEQQMRIQDHVWDNILQRSRTGDCTSDDILEIMNLVLTNPACDRPDFSLPPWDDSILVTPRNSVRAFWNEAMLSCHCRRTGHFHFILDADDKVDNKRLSREQRLAIAHLKLEKTGHLPNRTEIAIGMKAMILQNIATDVNLANGSRGIITDIILDPKENVPTRRDSPIRLSYPPIALLFSPYYQRDVKLAGLPQGTVPLYPSEKTFRLGGKEGVTIKRIQFALTAAYAFTDFKSQGQTIEHVIVDLAKTPTAGLTAFNAYVALSRSRGRDTIRLLRDFDQKLFTTHPNEELRKEDLRLAILQDKTMERYNTGEFSSSHRTR